MTSDHDALKHAASKEAALCTIVGIDGSFSRRCGAQLSVGRDGSLAGDMADNCLNEELANQAQAAMETGEAKLLRYGAGSPFIDFRLPCGAGLDIWIDPAPHRGALAHCVAELESRRATALDLAVNTAALSSEEKRPTLISKRAYIPSPRLIILGTGSECAALLGLAQAQGLTAEWREAGQGLALGQPPADLAVDAWTAILLLFHDHEWEHTLLEWALGTPAFFIGAQGGAPARQTRHERLLASGHSEADLSRIRSPIGLIPRARDAGVLALSAMAEVIAAHEALHPHR